MRDDKQIHVCEDISQEKGSGEEKKEKKSRNATCNDIKRQPPLPPPFCRISVSISESTSL